MLPLTRITQVTAEMHYLAIRSTLYAYISAIEEDLRDIITEQIWPTFNGLAFLSDERIAELMSLGVSQDDIYGVLFNLLFLYIYMRKVVPRRWVRRPTQGPSKS